MTLRSVNPRTGETGAPVSEAAPADVAHAAVRAATAFSDWLSDWRSASGRTRGRLLREMADKLESRRPHIIDVADFETALGSERLGSELTRTIDQLRSLAALVEEGSYVEAVLSPGDPEAAPVPRPDIRRCLVAVGPVGVFTPSNFPLAFGVAGGDTGSALAAGCSVVVKGHPSHPLTSDACFEACAQAVTMTGAPAGLLSLAQGGAPELSRTLVQAPEIKTVAFTGSQAAGRLLFDLAAARAEPIPFHGELGSVNPVFIGEHAARARPIDMAQGLAASILLGSGQFCTKPGLVFVPDSDAGDIFLAALTERMGGQGPGVLLNRGLRASLERLVADTEAVPGVEELTSPQPTAADACLAAPRLFAVDVQTFHRRPELAREHFGPVAIVVRGSTGDLADSARRLDGQLTATVHAEEPDEPWARDVLSALSSVAGRLIWNGYPTGVSVVPGMHHGGPYPASTSAAHSSVGATAIQRFLRPVAFQAVPDDLLPQALQRSNPLGIQRLVGGEWTRRRV
jgi:NADP-dependent aldehyde dehydrogenase